MRDYDYIYVGSSPADETCAQVGTWDYSERARAECRALIGQLRRVLGPEPEGARLAIKSAAHDFGTYYEVVCYYDDDMAAAVRYAFRCESECPARWDAEARKLVAAWLEGGE
jgi:hypothetical protein